MIRFKDKSYRVVIPVASELQHECVIKKLNTPDAIPSRGIKRHEVAHAILDALERGWTVVKDTEESNEAATWLIVASPETVEELGRKYGA